MSGLLFIMAKISNIEKQIGEIEGKARVLSGYQLKFVALIALSNYILSIIGTSLEEIFGY